MWHYNIGGEILNIRPQVFIAPVVKLRFKLFMPGVTIFFFGGSFLVEDITKILMRKKTVLSGG